MNRASRSRSRARVVSLLLLPGMLLSLLNGVIVPATAAPAERPASAGTQAAPAVPIPVNIVATKDDALVVSSDDGDSRPEPGEKLLYTVVVQNTGGADATGLSIADTVDGNTILDTTSFNVSPLAFDDAYSTIANTELAVGMSPAGGAFKQLSGSVTDNDVQFDDAFTVISFDGTSVSGGTVNMETDGNFTYLPAAGFNGVDSFTYTIEDTRGLSNIGEVEVTVSTEEVWYVDNNAPAGGDGRSSKPYDSLSDVSGASGGDMAGHTIYLYRTGAGDYNGGVTLLADQQLVGNGVALVINGTTLRAAGTAPNLTNTTVGTNAVTLASGNTVGNTLKGFTIGTGNATGAGIAGTNFGALTVSNVTINSTGKALDLDNGSASATGVTFGGITSSGGANNIELDGLSGNNAFNLGSGALSGATGNAFDVDNGTAPINYSGTIGNSLARSVRVENYDGGTIALSGAVSGTGTGVLLNSNTGTTINFSAGLNLNTIGDAFTATGGGTINATQNNTSILNILSSSTGTALKVQNTTIGASGLTFRSISAANGAGNGIILDNTGNTGGGFTIVGNNSAGSGGSIHHKTGADGSTTSGNGIYLNSTRNIALSWLQLNDFDNNGILGSSVVGFTMANSVINGTSGNNVNGPFFESAVSFQNLTGAASVTNSTIQGGTLDNFRLVNSSGTLNRIIFDVVTFNANGLTGGNGLTLEAQNNAVLNVTMEDSFITAYRATGMSVTGSNTAALDVQFLRNAVSNNHGNIVGGSINVQLGVGGGSLASPHNANMTFNVDNNSFRDSISGALSLDKGGVGTGSLVGTVTNNTVGVSGVANSGASQGSGMVATLTGGGNLNVTFTGNQIRQFVNAGIYVKGGQSSGGGATAGSPGYITSLIQSNTIAEVGPAHVSAQTVSNGIKVDGGINSGDTTRLCLTIGSSTAGLKNSAAGTGFLGDNSTGSDIRIIKVSTTVVGVTGLVGTTSTALNSHMLNQNVVNTASSSGTFQGSCPSPTASQPDSMLSGLFDGLSGLLGAQSSPAADATSAKPSAAEQADLFEAAMGVIASAVFGDASVAHAAELAAPAEQGKTTPVAKTTAAPAKPAAQGAKPTGPQADFTAFPIAIGTLPAGKQVTIVFQVTIKQQVDWSGPVDEVANHGTVSGTNFADVLTDDPNTVEAGRDDTITVINRAPTDIGLTGTSVAENQPSGTTVGTLSTVDPDAPHDTHTYSLVVGSGDADNASFAVDGTTLKTAASFNFETKNSYSIRLRTTDNGGLAFDEEFTITVTDVNESPTDISLSSTSVDENQPSGTAVGTLSSTDQDASNTHTYSLVAGSGDTDNASFTVDGTTLKTAASFDFETKNSYSIRLRTTDQGSLTFDKQFTITVNDVNESPTAIGLSSNSVDENAAIGTTVGTFSTTDPGRPSNRNTGPSASGQSHTYTLVSGTGSDDNAMFTIDGNALKTAAVFNYEVKNSYSVRVRSTDQGSLFTEQAFTISVNDLAEPPTDISLSNASVAENQPSGTAVGTLSTTGGAGTPTYTLVSGTGDADNAAFTVDGATLKTAAVFDFETKNSYSIRVRITDGDNLTYEEAFTIGVTDVNENPTGIGLSSTSVAENQPSGTTVGTFSTTDPGRPSGRVTGTGASAQTHTYTLVTGTGDTDNAMFTIDGATLKTAAVFDYETKNSYSIRVRSTDQGSLFTEQAFTISVNNVNELPTDISLSDTSVDESQPINTVVGTLSSVDPDSGATHTYSLVSGAGDTDNGSFNISGNQLRTSQVFNRTTKASYTIRVQTDDGAGGILAEQFTITVDPVAQAVTYIDAVGVTVAGNNISRAATGPSAWGYGATSNLAIETGTGYVEARIGALTDIAAFGLGNGNDDQGFNDIDFGFYFAPSRSSVDIAEKGRKVCCSSAIPYSTSDVFRVAIELDGATPVVRYYKGASLLYTNSSPVLSYPLRLDTALYTPGSALNGAMIFGGDLVVVSARPVGGPAGTCQNVSWTNILPLNQLSVVNGPGSAASIQRTAGTGWNAGASSNESFASGGVPGAAEATIGSAGGYVVFGLSKGDDNQSNTDVDYAFYAYPPTKLLQVLYRGSVVKSVGDFSLNDVLRVEFSGGSKLTFYRNDVPLLVATMPAGSDNFPALVDTSLYNTGARLDNVRLCSSSGGTKPVDANVPQVEFGEPKQELVNVSFGDVRQGDYFYDAVQYLGSRSIVSGYSDGTFRPYANTTRAQLAKMVVSAVGLQLENPAEPTFSDVSRSNPFYQFVETAVALRMVSGYSDGTFRPYNEVTRGQLAKMVVLGMTIPLEVGQQGHFSDVSASNPFYQYVETAYNRGLISGYADGSFKPGANATRGQIAKIVYQARQAR